MLCYSVHSIPHPKRRNHVLLLSMSSRILRILLQMVLNAQRLRNYLRMLVGARHQSNAHRPLDRLCQLSLILRFEARKSGVHYPSRFRDEGCE